VGPGPPSRKSSKPEPRDPPGNAAVRQWCNHRTVTERLFVWMTGVIAAAAAALAVRVQALPEVIDISSIPTGAGLGSLGATFYGAVRRFDPERLGRMALLGTFGGGGIVSAALLVALLLAVLS
jgi:hypothetical protein